MRSILGHDDITVTQPAHKGILHPQPPPLQGLTTRFFVPIAHNMPLLAFLSFPRHVNFRMLTGGDDIIMTYAIVIHHIGLLVQLCTSLSSMQTKTWSQAACMKCLKARVSAAAESLLNMLRGKCASSRRLHIHQA
jgi:hypothetical protein